MPLDSPPVFDTDTTTTQEISHHLKAREPSDYGALLAARYLIFASFARTGRVIVPQRLEDQPPRVDLSFERALFAAVRGESGVKFDVFRDRQLSPAQIDAGVEALTRTVAANSDLVKHLLKVERTARVMTRRQTNPFKGCIYENISDADAKLGILKTKLRASSDDLRHLLDVCLRTAQHVRCSAPGVFLCHPVRELFWPEPTAVFQYTLPAGPQAGRPLHAVLDQKQSWPYRELVNVLAKGIRVMDEQAYIEFLGEASRILADEANGLFDLNTWEFRADAISEFKARVAWSRQLNTKYKTLLDNVGGVLTGIITAATLKSSLPSSILVVVGGLSGALFKFCMPGKIDLGPWQIDSKFSNFFSKVKLKLAAPQWFKPRPGGKP